MLAAEGGHRECLEYAVEQGADLNAKDNYVRDCARATSQSNAKQGTSIKRGQAINNS